MQLFYSFAQFIMSEWVWSFTFAFYHPLVNIVTMIFLLMYYVKRSFIESVLYVVSSQLYALIVFALLTHVVFNFIFKIPFQDYDSHMIHPFWACFLLAAIFACLQISFFYFLRYWYSFSIEAFSVVAFASNVVSALVIFRYLPKM